MLISLPLRINNRFLIGAACGIDADIQACIGTSMSIRTGIDTHICIDANVRTYASTSIRIIVGVSIEISNLQEY